MQTIQKDSIFWKNLKNKEMVFKNGVINIQAAAYNGAHTVFKFSAPNSDSALFWAASKFDKKLPITDIVIKKMIVSLCYTDGEINSFYGSISIIKLVEDIDSTNVEFTQLIHDPQNGNGTAFSHSTLIRKITNFTMKNAMAHYGDNQFKTVTFLDRKLKSI